MDILRTRARQLRSNATDAERRLWRHLRACQVGGARFRRQHPVAGFVLDFACPELKLGVELDGGQHLEQRGYDAQRTERLLQHGYRVLRFWNDDVLLRTEAVLEQVLITIEALRGAAAKRGEQPE